MGRTGRWLVIMALLVILGSFAAPVAYVVGLAGRGRAVEQELARIRSAGEPVTPADLFGAPIPDTENAALVYQKCFDSFPRRPGFRTGGMLWGFWRHGDEARDADYWERARATVERYSGVLAMAEKAAAMPKCRFTTIDRSGTFGWSRHQSRVRILVRLASLKAQICAREGDTDAAVRYIKLAFRVADALKEEHNISGQRERCMAIAGATDALRLAAPMISLTESQACDLRDTIQKIDLRDCARDALWGERVSGIASYAHVLRDTHEVDEGGHMGAYKRLGNSLPGRIWLYSDELYYLNRMRQSIDGIRIPYRTFRTQQLDKDEKPPKYALFSALLVQSRDEILLLSDTAKTNLAGSQMLLGLLAYRHRFGRYPASLQGLQTRLNWNTPGDVFSGKPFIYHREGRGFVLYSVGDDLKDNGGVELDRTGSGDVLWKL